MARSAPTPMSEAELQLEALQCRKRGSSYRTIATLLSISPMHAYRLVKSALDNLAMETQQAAGEVADAQSASTLLADTEESQLAVTDRLMHNLPAVVDTLLHLAQGEAQRVEETWQPAGLIMIGKGEDHRPAFPDLPPDQLVLIGRKVAHAPADRKAAENILRTLLGDSLRW